ncbi:unnamed protein product [Linum tenue]|uniref:CCHC-type domain-containing protein n=1 Tax=Linum tenue TaxID=586396 RepID=A0AAV0NHZ3_9ROSI|nr:unnamed protein product [Linum tenue]
MSFLLVVVLWFSLVPADCSVSSGPCAYPAFIAVHLYSIPVAFMASELVEKLPGIDLTEDEEVVISMEDTVETEGVEEVIKELGLVGKVIKGNLPSGRILKKVLSEAWKLKRDFDVQVTKENILRLQLYYYEDKNKVLYGGPWHLERQLLIFKEVPPDMDLSKIEFCWADFWVRIRKFPLNMRNLQMAEKVGDMFGRFIRWDELHSGVSSEYMRIRVAMSTQKPLRRVVKMQSKEGPISYRVGYERLPIYCFKCGILGHLKKSCPVAQNNEDDNNDPYGSWMRAKSPLKKLSLKEKGKSHQLSKLW